VSPLGHLGLALVLVERLTLDRRAAVVLLVGAALPDLIDKPLGELGVVGAYHTVGHSVFVGAGLGVAGVALRGRWWVPPLVVGWWSHLVCDLYVAVPDYLGQYVWPLGGPTPPPGETLAAYAARYVTTHWFGTELLLLAVAAVLWVRHGVTTPPFDGE
jgi:hypothetical protein